MIDSELLSRYEIASKYNISYWQVSQLLRGKAAKVIKINQQQQKDICSNYICGDSITALSKRYNVCLRTIEKILKKNNVERRKQGPNYDTHLRDVVRKSYTEWHFDCLYRDSHICQVEDREGLKEDLTKYHC
jgi:Mor family transcriptional regulator